MVVSLSNCNVGVGRMPDGTVAVTILHMQSGVQYLLPLTEPGLRSLRQMLDAAAADIVVASAIPGNGSG